MLEYICKNCSTSFYRHTTVQTLCPKCQYNKYYAGKKRKPIKKIGKVTKQWWAVRNEWIQQNANKDNTWRCVVGDGLLNIDSLTLDHDVPRSRDPSKRNDLNNLNPMCAFHNSDKGSKSLDEYLATNPSKKCLT